MKTRNEKLEIIKDPSKVSLISLEALSETIKLDIKYATDDNFLGRPVYKKAMAYLQEEVANDLLKISNSLNNVGYGIVVFDAYRPWSVTKIFWDETPEDLRNFVANPEYGSNHNRGCALDISLYDLNTGRYLKMPSEYDAFNESAYPTYTKCDAESKTNRDFLINEFEKTGNFTVYQYEWWHFDHKNYKNYPVFDVPFEDISH